MIFEDGVQPKAPDLEHVWEPTTMPGKTWFFGITTASGFEARTPRILRRTTYIYNGVFEQDEGTNTHSNTHKRHIARQMF